MALTKSQATIWQKARSLGTGNQAVGLTDETCAYLVGRIVLDLGMAKDFLEIPKKLPRFFTRGSLTSLGLPGVDARALYERLVTIDTDADMYFACLAALHKARLKYERILSTQSLPTLEQVGPRGLLQYGSLSGEALAAFLFWRKWFFDIDNRAGQETGYLFEPIIANAIGGTPAPAGRSPVKRHRQPDKGRQVDCLLDDRAYELKIRVTIAASGQGRWQEELDFPVDCRKSGFTPVLVCMDGTPNPKLEALAKAFGDQEGEVYIGADAWIHLDQVAGATMSRFLDNYVRAPIEDLLAKASDDLPDMTARWSQDSIDIQIGKDTLHIDRDVGGETNEEGGAMPDDAADEIVKGSDPFGHGRRARRRSSFGGLCRPIRRAIPRRKRSCEAHFIAAAFGFERIFNPSLRSSAREMSCSPGRKSVSL